MPVDLARLGSAVRARTPVVTAPFTAGTAHALLQPDLPPTVSWSLPDGELMRSSHDPRLVCITRLGDSIEREIILQRFLETRRQTSSNL